MAGAVIPDAERAAIVDVHGEIATAIVRSAVYHEYLHLLRTSEGWRIVNAPWQST